MDKLINLLNVVSILIILALGLLVILRSNKDPNSKKFFLFVVSLALWLSTGFLLRFTWNYDLSLFVLRLNYALTGIVVYSLFVFSLGFPQKLWQKNTAYSLTMLVPTLLVVGISLSNAVVAGFTRDGSIINVVPSWGFVVFMVSIILQLLLVFNILLRQYRNSEGILRAQALFLFLGITLAAVFALVADLLIPLIFKTFITANFDAIWMFFLVGFCTYAILKHHLLSVKVITTESMVVIIVMVLVVQAFLSQGWTEGVLRGGFAMVVAYFGFLLIRSVLEEIDRRQQIEKLAKERQEALVELEQRNKNLATLQRISEVVLNESDMKVMAQKILDELPKQLEACAGGFLSIVKDGNLVAYAISSNEFSEKIVSMVGGDLEKYSFPIKKEYNLLHQVVVEKKPISSENLSDFISPPIDKPLAMTMQKIIGAREMEAFPLYAGGEPFGTMLFIYRHPVRQRNENIARAIADDMSLAIQRASAFQKLKDANEYLAQLDKMKDEFISMASHELNTPLAAIEGYLSMVLDEGMGKVDPKAKEYLGRAYESSKRLAELILDLLNVSRIEQGRLKVKFAETNLVDLAQSVIHELQIKADSKKIYMKLEANKKDVPNTWCDTDRIREVFVNFVGNALKFTEKGGVTVRVEKVDGKAVRGTVTDTGRGIAKVDQKKLFQKFSQIKRETDEHQGTGLGLYISKNFVDLHKGRVWVDSDEGKGATFGFEIPVLKAAPKEVEGAMLEDGAPKASGSPAATDGGHQVPKAAG
ncbi:hypothetical protein A3A71_01190 [Candidatus Berkelbacteria bacterium RIFCSPLOWO2_01_FULL_50_28]|uniref:histidine kinase n=1 Tax=Candidatus Berkelbacteria bacterium RIFCSPLOWO2_01_FULL_50_28 TaxID=1797471 RepID=A0A1F5EB62_9BACT|nr:MAG: hypothetical protein A2807_01760 [Candidatus Berkelbacteria bacterium RIFCSPHIGHO2_01_FULL_50_36]OGD64652.1 MAG: hypothetical protein A3A71_01190 [Candidatus Berkelbacteria bacterium RIFCSPLOWO2_01_FULL_50_28]